MRKADIFEEAIPKQSAAGAASFRRQTLTPIRGASRQLAAPISRARRLLRKPCDRPRQRIPAIGGRASMKGPPTELRFLPSISLTILVTRIRSMGDRITAL